MSKYCKGQLENLCVVELEGKVYRDKDLYKVSCNICGETKETTARRPSEVLLKCKETV